MDKLLGFRATTSGNLYSSVCKDLENKEKKQLVSPQDLLSPVQTIFSNKELKAIPFYLLRCNNLADIASLSPAHPAKHSQNPLYPYSVEKGTTYANDFIWHRSCN